MSKRVTGPFRFLTPHRRPRNSQIASRLVFCRRGFEVHQWPIIFFFKMGFLFQIHNFSFLLSIFWIENWKNKSRYRFENWFLEGSCHCETGANHQVRVARLVQELPLPSSTLGSEIFRNSVRQDLQVFRSRHVKIKADNVTSIARYEWNMCCFMMKTSQEK